MAINKFLNFANVFTYLLKNLFMLYVYLAHSFVCFLACQQMNYQQGLQIHTEMVIRGNFSEIGSFMPGLKTLMQIATNLRV